MQSIRKNPHLITIRSTKELAKALDDLAELTHKTKSQLLLEMIDEYNKTHLNREILQARLDESKTAFEKSLEQAKLAMKSMEEHSGSIV